MIDLWTGEVPGYDDRRENVLIPDFANSGGMAGGTPLETRNAVTRPRSVLRA